MDKKTRSLFALPGWVFLAGIAVVITGLMMREAQNSVTKHARRVAGKE